MARSEKAGTVNRLDFAQMAQARDYLIANRERLEREELTHQQCADELQIHLKQRVTVGNLPTLLDSIQPPLKLREATSGWNTVSAKLEAQIAEQVNSINARISEIQNALNSTIADMQAKMKVFEDAFLTITALEDQWKKCRDDINLLGPAVARMRIDLDVICEAAGVARLNRAVVAAGKAVSAPSVKDTMPRGGTNAPPVPLIPNTPHPLNGKPK